MSIKANCNVTFIIILWILKSPTNKALSATGTNSDRKSAKQWQAVHVTKEDAMTHSVCKLILY